MFDFEFKSNKMFSFVKKIDFGMQIRKIFHFDTLEP